MSFSAPRFLRDSVLGWVWRSGSRHCSSPERTESLLRLLRRYPDWSLGHRLLAEDALDRDDVAQAYAASLCYLHLTNHHPSKRGCAYFLTGKCYLRRGDWHTALAHLKHALEDLPSSPPVLEELAAAYMLGGKYSDARSTLEQVSERMLSAQAKAALAFARSKDTP